MPQAWGPTVAEHNFVSLPEAYRRLRVGTFSMNTWLTSGRLFPVVNAQGSLGVDPQSLFVLEAHRRNAGPLRKTRYALVTLLRQQGWSLTAQAAARRGGEGHPPAAP